jgi:hydrophobic/amphiphilic exporter-1 (mainly G- bacteria), HAE1 family
MGLPDFSIKKPVTTVMIFTGVILFGVISLFKLSQELFPPIKYPQLTVFTGYANAAPAEIETLLTKPIEEAVGTVSGLRSIRSISREGVSLVFAEFGWEQNMDFASLRVREKVDLVKARLPRDASEPLVVPFNPFELPILRISVTGRRSPVQLRKIAVDTIKEELEKIDGVASASVEGGLDREILVEINQGKLHAYDVPILDVSDAITNANLNYPAGTIKESFYEYLIRTLGEFENVEEIREVVVKSDIDEGDERLSFEERKKSRNISRRTNFVQIKDVAEVKDTVKDRTSFSRFNGDENVSVTIQKQSQTNTIQVAGSIRKALGPLGKKLPKDIKLEIIYDQSLFIHDAIDGVRDAALQGGVLAFLVLLVFLRNFKASAIVTLSIPISIMVVFTFMYFGGLSINIMSLGGLALGVGMLVDNAIVVIENIFRHRALGKSAEEAAGEGAEEVSNAIVASTLTTIAVFLPMVFVVGIAGQLFKELAFTVTFSLIGSLWVALTLIPLLSCKLGGKKDTSMGMKAFAGGELWQKVVKKYDKFLRIFLKKKKLGLLFILGIFLASLFLVNFLEKELMPKTDQGEFVVKVDMPVGTVVNETNDMVLLLEEEITAQKDVESASSVVGSASSETAQDVVKSIGSHQGQIIVILKEKRKSKTVDVVRVLQDIFQDGKYKPAKIEILMQQGIMSGSFGGGGKPITIVVKGDNLLKMGQVAEKVRNGLNTIDGVFGVEDDMPEPAPEIRLTIDKDKAALHSLSVVDLARVAQIILRGYIPSQFKENGKEVDIRVVLREEDRATYDQLYRVRVSSPTSGKVPLGMVASFEKGVGPSEIRRVSQEKTITISANMAGRKMSNVMGEVEKIIKGIKSKGNCRIRIAGESEEMVKSFNSLKFALILSIVLVYMIMAAQFESLTQPLIILFTVPLSLIGVLIALYATNTSVSVVALLGVIMLGGIVVNNGIVMIDYTNILMGEGKNVMEAVIEASRARLRPIIMTALTTVLGLLPMAIAVGRGSELRAPMAISVMGGLLISTFLTLVVIPSIFVLESEIRASIRVYAGKHFNK